MDGIVGCNNPKLEQDKAHIEVAKECTYKKTAKTLFK